VVFAALDGADGVVMVVVETVAVVVVGRVVVIVVGVE